MLLFPKKKKIILHSPKTGGTFIKSLFNNTNECKIYSGKISYAKNEYELSHLTLNEIKKFGIKTTVKKDFKIYCFARNVKDRVNSSIHECLRQNLLDINVKGFYNTDDITNALNKLIDLLEKQNQNNWENYDLKLIHFKPQIFYIKESHKILNYNLIKDNESLSKLFQENFEVEITKKMLKQKKIYPSKIPYTSNNLLNFVFRKNSKKNYLTYRILNYSLKKKIDFSIIFKKEFDKIYSFYKEDRKLLFELKD